MKTRVLSLSIALLFAFGTQLKAQESQPQEGRSGWTFGVLPSVSFDADLGFQFGALTNIYYFGDGSTYPDYIHSFYAEAAYTTRRYGVFRLSYDSKYLIPGYRTSVDVAYLPDAMCDFYGFNGYQTAYHSDWTDDASATYLTRAYYKMKRDLFKLNIDIQHNIAGNWYWNGGIGLFNYTIDRVDFEMLNKGKDDDKQLPDVPTLYDKYLVNGLISADEANGGFHPYVHGGLTFDTRDRQQNPRKGIHADAFLTYTGAFGDQSEFNNLRFNAAWRQYLPIIDRKLIFAYRLGTQLLLAGQSTFYQNTYMNQLYNQRVLYEGLGGGNSLRGIMRNRILADGFAYANIEMRIQLFKFKIKKENFYIGINPFMDGGMVLQERKFENEIFTPDLAPEIDLDADNHALHLSAGCGLKVAMNDNFVLSVDWATPLDKQDNGKLSNLYIKMGYMF